jgi:hypothetical protein
VTSFRCASSGLMLCGHAHANVSEARTDPILWFDEGGPVRAFEPLACTDRLARRWEPESHHHHHLQSDGRSAVTSEQPCNSSVLSAAFQEVKYIIGLEGKCTSKLLRVRCMQTLTHTAGYVQCACVRWLICV